jgi:DNA helicase IV
VDPVHLLIKPEELDGAIKAAVADLREEVEGTIAVIVPDAAVRERWHKEEDERTSVVTAVAAKGMEYDAVVLVEPGRLQVSTRYVALSRATQRLITIATASWL